MSQQLRRTLSHRLPVLVHHRRLFLLLFPAPSSSEILKNVSRNNTKSDVDERLKEERLRKYEDQKERNRKAAARSRMRFKAISMLKELPKNKNKTDDELVLQLPIDLQPISNRWPFGDTSHYEYAIDYARVKGTNGRAETIHMRDSFGSSQMGVNSSCRTCQNITPKDTSSLQCYQKSLYRSNRRKKFVKEMLKDPTKKTEYGVLSMLPETKICQPPPSDSLGTGKRKNTENRQERY